jgi:putative copper export protein/mono/diheme cytochrome c family protein
MIPPFEVQGGMLLAGARFASVTALLSSFGTLVFRTVVAPAALLRMPAAAARDVKRRLLLVTQLSCAACALATAVWLCVQAGAMADAENLAGVFAAVPTVLAKTVFGHVVTAQFAALLAVSLAAGARDAIVRQRGALVLATCAVALQAGHSHALSMYGGPSWLLAADILHLLGAGAWLGGLLPLVLLVQAAPAACGAIAARWFSPLGKACIAALIVSALFQGWVLVASIPGLIGTAYGWMILIKMVLFSMLLGFAAVNRYRFAPALLLPDARGARLVLLRSVSVQTGFALAIVMAAALLSELPPAMHGQSLWPFARRLSLDAVSEDPDFRREVIIAGLALAGALALVAVACLLRRLRLAAVALAAVIAWFAVPHFDLLLVDAYPTSFFHSPTGFTAASIAVGSDVYAGNCVSCHGANGNGDGPAAKTLTIPPANLTAGHLWMHSDGELFWWLTHGIDSPEGGLAMPGFGGVLDEDQRWAVIDYIRAHNAGQAWHLTGLWPVPVQAPELSALCGGRSVGLTDLRGGFVRLVIGAMARDEAGVVTVLVNPPDGVVAPGMCVSNDEVALRTYAILAGVDGGAVRGMEFLVDGAGWLRAVQPAETRPGWDDPATLKAELAKVRAQQLAPSGAAAMPMTMPMKMPM